MCPGRRKQPGVEQSAIQWAKATTRNEDVGESNRKRRDQEKKGREWTRLTPNKTKLGAAPCLLANAELPLVKFAQGGEPGSCRNGFLVEARVWLCFLEGEAWESWREERR